MEFRVIKPHTKIEGEHRNVVFLRVDHWNDYSFVTLFHMVFYDRQGKSHSIGGVRIGFKGQSTGTATYEKLGDVFKKLKDQYFSLGSNIEFYIAIAKLGDQGRGILKNLNDLVNNPSLIEEITEEKVFSVALLRDSSLSVIKGQYHRVLNGGKTLTDFEFSYVRAGSERFSGIKLSFDVDVDSKPSTNIHAIIGRNGVGKTTLLNDMIRSVTNPPSALGKFIEHARKQEKDLDKDYFSSLVSVSFSAFDPFIPPKEQPNPAKGTCYYYIGLKDSRGKGYHRDIDSLQDDCCNALTTCFNDPDKDRLWCSAIENLGYDENFSATNLITLKECFSRIKESTNKQIDSFDFKMSYFSEIKSTLDELSSGHAIVLLTISRLVATVQEKTLVLIDEPESHLHPPLLAAFLRALSELLLTINGVAIIATHSPVVMQEIPKDCVWKIYRQGDSTIVDRPKIETFAENLGILTSEVFGLEVELSGFHNILKQSVDAGSSYQKILREYRNQIGFEGRAILKALIADRDKDLSND